MTSLRAAVWRAARSLDGGIETAGRLIGRNPQTLRNELIGQERHKLDIGDAEAIIDLANSDELAIAAAAQRGGVFIRMDHQHASADVSDLAILELMARAWRTNGDVGRIVDEVLADGRVDRAEILQVKASVIRAQQALADMVTKLETLAG
jgi:hypothetical protein